MSRTTRAQWNKWTEPSHGKHPALAFHDLPTCQNGVDMAADLIDAESDLTALQRERDELRARLELAIAGLKAVPYISQLEAERTALQSRLDVAVSALEAIASTGRDDNPWFEDIARTALQRIREGNR